MTEIRTAKLDDLKRLSEIESLCFPILEAASKDSIEKRLKVFATHFYVLYHENDIIGFVNGMVSNQESLSDEMYDDAQLHDENGSWQMIFGLDVIPAFRNKGMAALLMNHIILQAKNEGRKGLVLTCKEHLIHYYAKFGFCNEGVSQSVHGNVVWYQMRLSF